MLVSGEKLHCVRFLSKRETDLHASLHIMSD